MIPNAHSSGLLCGVTSEDRPLLPMDDVVEKDRYEPKGPSPSDSSVALSTPFGVANSQAIALNESSPGHQATLGAQSVAAGPCNMEEDLILGGDMEKIPEQPEESAEVGDAGGALASPGHVGAAAATRAIQAEDPRRTAEIQNEIRKHEETLERLKAKYKGIRGRYKREDQSLKRRAERSLLILGEGKLPAKNKQRASFPSRDNVHPPAGASLGGSPGCPSESAEAQGVGSALPGEPVTPSGASGNAGIKRRASERSTGERSAGDGDEEGAEEDEGEDGEEEKAYTVWGDDQKVPPAQAVFIQQVIECAKKGLSAATSHIYRPLDPVKGFHEGMTFEEFSISAVHVICWHLFYAQQGLPRFPPCPRHGWKAVQQSQVESKGWTKGRRVYGLSKDEYLVGTRHSCGLCRVEKRALQEQAAECQGDAVEKVRRDKAARSHQYIYSSYDPMVTQWYVDSFPFIAEKMTVVISTRKTAVTKELKTLAQRLGSSPYELMNLRKDMRAMQTAADRATFDSLQHMASAGGAGAGAGAQGGEREGSAETAGSVREAQREVSPGDATGERRDASGSRQPHAEHSSGSLGPQLQQPPLGQRITHAPVVATDSNSGPSRQTRTEQVPSETSPQLAPAPAASKGAAAPFHSDGAVVHDHPPQGIESMQASSLRTTPESRPVSQENSTRDQSQDEGVEHDQMIDTGLEKSTESSEHPPGIGATALGSASGGSTLSRSPPQRDAGIDIERGTPSGGDNHLGVSRVQAQGSSEHAAESPAGSTAWGTHPSGECDPGEVSARVSCVVPTLRPRNMPEITLDAVSCRRDDELEVSGKTAPVRLSRAVTGKRGTRSVGDDREEGTAVRRSQGRSTRCDLVDVREEDGGIDISGGGCMTMAGGDLSVVESLRRLNATSRISECSRVPAIGEEPGKGVSRPPRYGVDDGELVPKQGTEQGKSPACAPSPQGPRPKEIFGVECPEEDQGVSAGDSELETTLVAGPGVARASQRGPEGDAPRREDGSMVVPGEDEFRRR